MTTELKWILLCAAVALGEGCGFAAGDYAAMWPIAAGATGLAAAVGYGLAWRFWPYLFAGLLGFTLALQATDRRCRLLDEALEERAGRPLMASFVIGDDMREEGPGRVTFLGEANGIPVRVHLAVPDGETGPRPGEVWSCTGWLGRSGDGPFGRRRPFWVNGRGADARRTAVSAGRWAEAFRRVRTDFSRRVGLGLDHAPETADLNRAMLLGERHRVTEESRAAFVAAGTVHVFAISGLHVLFVAHLLELVLGLVRLPRRVLCLVLLPLVWAYVVLVGCGPSAVRAATMVSFYYSAVLFWRRPNGFTAWSLAFLLTYLRDPVRVFDTGCSFSFAVMFALVLWNRWCGPFVPGLFGRIGLAAVAWAAGVPVAAHVFGRVTPGGLLTNLAAVPLAGISVSTAALGVMASYVSDGLAAHFNNFAALSTGLMAGLSRLVGSWSWSNRTVIPWSVAECVAWYAAGLLVLFVLRAVFQRNRPLL